MNKNRIDIRFTALTDSEEYKYLEKIKDITKISDNKAILKSCLKVAYSEYYSKLDEALNKFK
ncbi:MAG: hypothetical protein ACTSWY_07610 [Promethearchaeota archaeon]